MRYKENVKSGLPRDAAVRPVLVLGIDHLAGIFFINIKHLYCISQKLHQLKYPASNELSQPIGPLSSEPQLSTTNPREGNARFIAGWGSVTTVTHNSLYTLFTDSLFSSYFFPRHQWQTTPRSISLTLKHAVPFTYKSLLKSRVQQKQSYQPSSNFYVLE